MALFKNGSKMVSFKNVKPADSVYLTVKPSIYIADVEGIVEGDDFEATTQATRSKQFQLFPGNPHVKIQITQKASGELVFSEA
jgi:ligand-binding sensor domain-containing protein